MKIQAKNPNVKSMNLIVPIDGLITIDDKGMVDVTAKCAVELVKNTNDWSYVGKVAESVEKASEADKVTESIVESEEKEEEIVLTEESLATLTIKSLREMCAEAGYDESEYKKYNKADLIKYILKKIG
jgi:4'-phosphopantetheinyl transferase EntD